MRTCPCRGRKSCAACRIEIRESRGVWAWRGNGRPRPPGRRLGIFSGRVSFDGVTVIPYCGPRAVRLDRPAKPGSDVVYRLLEIDGALVAEQVKGRAA